MTTRRAARAVARLAALASLIVGLLLAWAGAAGAHPLGNFTVNQYTGLRLLPDRVRVDYVLDMAEIPAFQTRQEIDADGDQKVSAAEAGSWRLASCPRLAAGLVVHLDGQRLDLATTASRLSFPPGSGGLPTLQALLVASTVTLTHTAGVLALGVALSASTALAPERIYPWLGLASGLLLASVGVTLLRRAVRAARPRHAHGHPHQHRDGRPPGWRGLMPMGFAGGLVPSPSALVVLLGAIALGRAWFGVLLVLAYGAGMAMTLTGAGLLLVHARAALDRRASAPARPGIASLSRVLPLVSAAAIIVVGLFLAAQGASGI